jgi:hypothetical protein
VEGEAVRAGVGSTASLKINGRKAASFDDARKVATRMVDLAFGWHMLQIDVTVSPSGGGGGGGARGGGAACGCQVFPCCAHAGL